LNLTLHGKIMKTFIIAEAGVNHNGKVALAKKMIDVAALAGVDAIKFQTFKAEKLASKFAPKADYQKETTRMTESQQQMLKKLELSWEAHKILLDRCCRRNIKFLSTPFDIDSVRLLAKLGLDIFKVPSGEITNLPYLRVVGRLRKKVILSTGMANLREVKDAVKVLTDSGTFKKNITILHCHTEYPTWFEDVNLSAMITLQKEIGTKVGYSDHTLGIEVPIAAVALGACMIEKHFTLDKNMEGPDHKASLNPDELKAMIVAIRHVEEALGHGIKRPSRTELKNRWVVRKSIVAAQLIRRGEPFTEENLSTKRPAKGISPMLWDRVVGRIAKKDYKEDEAIVL